MTMLVGMGNERARRMQVADPSLRYTPMPTISELRLIRQPVPSRAIAPSGRTILEDQRCPPRLLPPRLRSPSPRKEAKDYVISSSRRTPNSSPTRRSIHLPRRNTQQLNPITTESAIRASFNNPKSPDARHDAVRRKHALVPSLIHLP
jgi:hypothetical protein